MTEGDRERKLVSDIEEVGWHVIMVPEEDEGPSFAYIIGFFQTFGHPEVVIVGLDSQVMHQLINSIGEAIRRGQRYANGQAASGILEGFDVRFTHVARRHYPEYLGYAGWFYKGDDFPASQCLWPDKQGRFPSDHDFAEALRSRQTLLGE